MVGLEDPGVALPLAGALVLLLAAAVVLWRGGRRGAPLWLAVFLAGQGVATLVFTYGFLSTAPSSSMAPSDFNRAQAFSLAATGVAALAGLGLLWFLHDFPARPSPVEQRSFFLAGGLVLAVLTASAALTLDFFRILGQTLTAGEAASFAGSLFLGALAKGPVLLAMLALPLRYFAAQGRPWDRAALAWFAAALSLSPALEGGMSFIFNARASAPFTGPVPLIIAGLDLAVVGIAALLWLRATTAGPREATRTARNLALLVVALVAAGFLLLRLGNQTPPWNLPLTARVAADVVMAAMVLDAVLRQRLLEVAPGEPPARQVEAPPPA